MHGTNSQLHLRRRRGRREVRRRRGGGGEEKGGAWDSTFHPWAVYTAYSYTDNVFTATLAYSPSPILIKSRPDYIMIQSCSHLSQITN